MGLFDHKKRTGQITTIKKGVQYVWEVKEINELVPNENYHSPLTKTSKNVNFHFVLFLRPTGEISFFVHHKRIPIPKFTYCLGSETECHPRQHTAILLPDDAERCGHLNVTSVDEMKSLISGYNTKLYVYFKWDFDTLNLSTEGGCTTATWTIPEFNSVKLNPFSSRTFTFHRQYTFRIDTSGENNMIFIFARLGSIAPHKLLIQAKDSDSSDLVVEPRTDGQTNVLRCTYQELINYCVDNTLTIKAIFSYTNPLALLDAGSPVLNEKKDSFQGEHSFVALDKANEANIGAMFK